MTPIKIKAEWDDEAGVWCDAQRKAKGRACRRRLTKPPKQKITNLQNRREKARPA